MISLSLETYINCVSHFVVVNFGDILKVIIG